jgi:hypothetical protein
MHWYVSALRANATTKRIQLKQLSRSCRYQHRSGEVTMVEALVPIKRSSVGVWQSLHRYRIPLIRAPSEG